MKTNRLVEAALTGTIIFPITICFYVVFQYGVDVPIFDQIRTPGSHIANLASGEFSLGDIFAQHNESRKPVPTVIFLALSLLDRTWIQPREMFAALLLGSLTTLFFFLTAVRLTEGNRRLSLGLTLIFSVIYFAPGSYWRWLNGISLHRIIPDFCLVFSCWVYTLSISPKKKLVFYAIASLAAQYSFVGGLFCWPLCFLLIWYDHQSRSREKRNLGILFATIFLISTCAYFGFGYQMPYFIGSSESANGKPMELLGVAYGMLTFLLSGLSRKLSYHEILILGISSIIVYVIVALLLLKKQGFKLYLPLIVIGLFPVFLSIPAALGRPEQVLSKLAALRYYPHSALFLIGLCCLVLVSSIHYTARSHQLFRAIFLVIFIDLLVSHNNGYWGYLIQERHKRLELRSCIQLLEFHNAESCFSRFYSREIPEHEKVAERLRRISEGGFFRYPVLTQFPRRVVDASGEHGRTEYLRLVDRRLAAHGWAWIAGEPAEAIVVLLDKTEEDREIVAIGPAGTKRTDISDALNRSHPFSGWRIKKDLASHYPVDKLRIYAFDAESRALYSLPLSSESQKR